MSGPVHVPADLPRRTPCPIAFVAEAPGDEEVNPARGEPRPLIGPSGRVFNAMLRTAGLSREDHWVGNLFDVQLPENEVGWWCAPAAEARAGKFSDLPPIGSAGFLLPEHRGHLDRLREELERANPRIIVPLGGTALWAFTGDASITACRGAVAPARFILPGAKLLPTFHPAHVMRDWRMYSIVAQDFMKAATQAARGPEIVYPRRRLLLEPTLPEWRSYAKRLLRTDLISVDIETAWGQVTCIGFALNKEEAICVPFVDLRRPDKNYWATLEEEIEAWGLVQMVLESPVPKLGQNYAMYDAYWLLEKLGIRTMNLRHDTRLAHHALYPELPKDLGFMGATYTEQGPWKLMRTHRKEKRDD